LPAKYAKKREKREKSFLPANNANHANEEAISISVIRVIRGQFFLFRVLSRPFACFAGKNLSRVSRAKD